MTEIVVLEIKLKIQLKKSSNLENLWMKAHSLMRMKKEQAKITGP